MLDQIPRIVQMSWTRTHAFQTREFIVLQFQGVGANVKHAKIEEEDQLWDAGTMGIFNPKVLLHAVFFLC